MRRNKHKQEDMSRRDFMWKGGCASLGIASMASTIWDLRFMNAALATTSGPITDYKALVCVFLFGGNDANNVLIPTDPTTYNNIYVPQRGGVYSQTSNTTSLAISPAGTVFTPTAGASFNIGVLPIAPLVSDGHTYGLHPSMTELQGLFSAGKMAMLANVGTLVYPLNRTQYFNNTVPKPYQLFSHNDQQVQWQTSVSDKPTTTGWGGRSADSINDAANGTAAVSMSVSLGGQNTFEVGSAVSEYTISSNGAPGPVGNFGTGANSQLQALNDLIGYRVGDQGYSAQYSVSNMHSNLYEQSYSSTTRNGIANAVAVSAVINAMPGLDPAFATFNTLYGGSNSLSGLAQQLRGVIRMIKGAQTTFFQKRQIFFVQTGGFDLHTNEGGAIGAHANLLRDVSRALKGFYDATVVLGLATNVTAFTVSDFSRTFQMNGGFGADHGWGNHQMIVGGAVNGQKIYGQFTDLVVSSGTTVGQFDTGTGRWIPTTSCDEYFACLARWYGVSTTDIASTVLPNIGHFANNLNFV